MMAADANPSRRLLIIPEMMSIVPFIVFRLLKYTSPHLMEVSSICRKPRSEDALVEELWTRSRDSAANHLAANHWAGTESFHSRGSQLRIFAFVGINFFFVWHKT